MYVFHPVPDRISTSCSNPVQGLRRSLPSTQQPFEAQRLSVFRQNTIHHQVARCLLITHNHPPSGLTLQTIFRGPPRARSIHGKPLTFISHALPRSRQYVAITHPDVGPDLGTHWPHLSSPGLLIRIALTRWSHLWAGAAELTKRASPHKR